MFHRPCSPDQCLPGQPATEATPAPINQLQLSKQRAVGPSLGGRPGRPAEPLSLDSRCEPPPPEPHGKMAPGRARIGPAYWEAGWVVGQSLRWDWCQAHPGVGVDSSEAAFKQISPGLWCPLYALVFLVQGGCEGFKSIPGSSLQETPCSIPCLPG